MDGKKIVDSTLTLASIGVDLATSNYIGAALQSIEAIRDFARDAEAAKLGRWFKGMATSKVWETPQEVQGLIAAKIKENPKAKETIWAAAKAILETISDEAAEVIGSLTAEYVRDGKGPDPFFRGAVRVLADLSTEELEVLQLILRSALPQYTSFALNNDNTLEFYSERSFERIHVDARAFAPEVRRIVRLLKGNDLGQDGPLVADGGLLKMVWAKNAAKRLGVHLGVI